MQRLVWLALAALVLLLTAAAVVGHWRERALYEQLADQNHRADSMEHRSATSAPVRSLPPIGSGR